MAGLCNRDGRWVIQYAEPGGARKTIYLGRMDRKSARVICAHVESLFTARFSGGVLPDATAAWLGTIGDTFHERLSRFGLVPPRKAKEATGLAAVLDGYIARRTDLKERTLSNLQQTRRVLVEFFGADRNIGTINRAEARDWQRKMAGRFAAATACMHVKKARQFFADAVDRALVNENPFSKLKLGSQVNASRNRYVPAADIERVIAACPDAEWRLVFALARYGGLRMPSEMQRLRWQDVDWDAGLMHVHSPKTEHHEGGDARFMPILPALFPHLRERFERAEPEEEYMLPKLRGENLRTTAKAIIGRAGLNQWPRLFQNLRASCETDLTAEFPLHVVCTWIGNSQLIAARHYLQVTGAHVAKATGRGTQTALSTGADQRFSQPPDPKSASAGQIPAIEYPIRPSNEAGMLRENLVWTRDALQNALQRLTEAAPHIRQNEIDRLSRAVAAAKGGATC